MDNKDFIKLLTNYIKINNPFIFAKFGDGEWICANQDKFNGSKGYSNCDNDTYTPKLQQGIIQSFKHIVNIHPNCYIGAWHTPNVLDYWNSILEDSSKINWVNYHTFILDDLNDKPVIDLQLELYKAIQQSNRKKIIICNPLLEKSKSLLNADSLIHVKFQNWFDTDFEYIFQLTCNEIGNQLDPIVITSCGMGAKVLISELYKLYPNGTFIDIGSAMDFICTKRNTRKREYTYEELYNAMLPILPEDWHDPKYEPLYHNAYMYLISP